MKVSCICPTYGRCPADQHLLEEAIESFLRQDYKDKELIVLNDSHQELVYESRHTSLNQTVDDCVRIINGLPRFTTLGEKYNAMVELADGELICPWEDDDISLSWRISESVLQLGESDFWNPKRYWFLDRRGLHYEHAMGVSHNCSIYRKAAWEIAGKYEHTSGPQDSKMDAALRKHTRSAGRRNPTVENWFYIYRWGVGYGNLSGKRPHQSYYDEVGKRVLDGGQFVLVPHWTLDYEELCFRSLPQIGSTPSPMIKR